MNIASPVLPLRLAMPLRAAAASRTSSSHTASAVNQSSRNRQPQVRHFTVDGRIQRPFPQCLHTSKVHKSKIQRRVRFPPPSPSLFSLPPSLYSHSIKKKLTPNLSHFTVLPCLKLPPSNQRPIWSPRRLPLLQQRRDQKSLLRPRKEIPPRHKQRPLSQRKIHRSPNSIRASQRPTEETSIRHLRRRRLRPRRRL